NESRIIPSDSRSSAESVGNGNTRSSWISPRNTPLVNDGLTSGAARCGAWAAAVVGAGAGLVVAIVESVIGGGRRVSKKMAAFAQNGHSQRSPARRACRADRLGGSI